MAAMLLIAAGVWSALRLPIDAVPDITNVQVVINTTVAALSPEEIEKQVTFPIEMETAGIPGLEEVRSLSKFGLSQITMVFSEGTDIYRARQLVGERLQSVAGEGASRGATGSGADFDGPRRDLLLHDRVQGRCDEQTGDALRTVARTSLHTGLH